MCAFWSHHSLLMSFLMEIEKGSLWKCGPQIASIISTEVQYLDRKMRTKEKGVWFKVEGKHLLSVGLMQWRLNLLVGIGLLVPHVLGDRLGSTEPPIRQCHACQGSAVMGQGFLAAGLAMGRHCTSLILSQKLLTISYFKW